MTVVYKIPSNTNARDQEKCQDRIHAANSKWLEGFIK